MEKITLLTEGGIAFNLKSCRRKGDLIVLRSEIYEVTEWYFTFFVFLKERANGTCMLRLFRNSTSHAKS